MSDKRVVNGHILRECLCGTCPICSWGASICGICGKAEAELDGECAKIVQPEEAEQDYGPKYRFY